MSKEHAQFDPSYSQLVALTKGYENTGRARALLEAAGRPVPASLQHPKQTYVYGGLGGMLAGAGTGSAIGLAAADSHRERQEYARRGLVLGAAAGAGIGTLLMILLNINKTKKVKKELDEGTIPSSLDPLRLPRQRYLRELARRSRAMSLIEGSGSGPYEAGYVDQLASMAGGAQRPALHSGYAQDALDAVGFVPGIGLVAATATGVINASKGVAATERAKELLNQKTAEATAPARQALARIRNRIAPRWMPGAEKAEIPTGRPKGWEFERRLAEIRADNALKEELAATGTPMLPIQQLQRDRVADVVVDYNPLVKR